MNGTTHSVGLALAFALFVIFSGRRATGVNTGGGMLGGENVADDRVAGRPEIRWFWILPAFALGIALVSLYLMSR